MKKNLLVAGIAGCVGHYLYDLLIKNPDYNIYFFVRTPKKILFDYKTFPNATLIEDDIINVGRYPEIMNKIDCLINLTADWGSEKGNYAYNLILFNALNLERCTKIIYFSTASILGENNRPVDKVQFCGTPYIRGKYLMHKHLQTLPIRDRTITLFPTWVLGGDKTHPYSHASLAIQSMAKWLWLIRFFSIDIRFHFIHAQDIAAITNYLLESNLKNGEYVLGNPVTDADHFIDELGAFFHQKRFPKIHVSDTFIKQAAALTRKRLSEWDKYCLENRRMEHHAVNAKDFDLPSNHDTVEKILEDLFRK